MFILYNLCFQNVIAHNENLLSTSVCHPPPPPMEFLYIYIYEDNYLTLVKHAPIKLSFIFRITFQSFSMVCRSCTIFIQFVTSMNKH